MCTQKLIASLIKHTSQKREQTE